MTPHSPHISEFDSFFSQLFLRGGEHTAELASAIGIGTSLLGELPATVGGPVGGMVGGGLIEQVRALMSDDEMVE